MCVVFAFNLYGGDTIKFLTTGPIAHPRPPPAALALATSVPSNSNDIFSKLAASSSPIHSKSKPKSQPKSKGKSANKKETEDLDL